MNWQHFSAFLWLRWRIRMNQLRKGGVANIVILAFLAFLMVAGAIGLSVGCFAGGYFGLGREDASSNVVLVAWDVIVLTFLLFWMIGLMAELQRSESLALSKFLHLPVSISGAFVINYLSSLFGLTMFLMTPAMLGLALGELRRGSGMLLVFPVLASFLLMVTALTYQFQGWLASLMQNPRRRRTIVVFVTLAMILVFQLPNLLNMMGVFKGKGLVDSSPELTAKQEELERSLEKGDINRAEYDKLTHDLKFEQQKQHAEAAQEKWRQIVEIAELVNLVLPPGWLALGAKGAAEGNPVPALLGTLAMSGIGVASLWRAYRTTLRLYLGEFTAGKPRAVKAAPAPSRPGPKPETMLTRRLPWISEHAAVIALGCFRSLLRAPEAKMMLLTPVIMICVFASLVVKGAGREMPELARPLCGFAAIAMALMTMVQIIGNQFGFDRNGFRVFILCPAPRREILLGKNLSAAPLALGLALLGVLMVQFVFPMRADYFLSLLPQMVSMYLLFCMLANLLSILAPMRIAPGTMKAQSPKAIAILLGIAFMLAFPVILAPTLMPLGLQALSEMFDYGWLPTALVASVVECVLVILLYRLVLSWEGAFLQYRELQILESVTTKDE